MIEVERFVELVRHFLASTEQFEEQSEYTYLKYCAMTLPLIYAYGLQLPDVNILTTEEQSINLPTTRINIKLPLKNRRFYHLIYDPIADTESVMGDIADDLADIYWDLYQPLIKYDSLLPETQVSAIWEWKFNIAGHCGDHIVNVLRPLHALIHYYTCRLRTI